MVDEMKARELREKSLDELVAQRDELTEKLARERVQLSIKRLDNPLQVRVTRRDLARVNTVIREKERAGETVTAPGREGPAETGAS
jgi:large subunit ribosomal protein L29